MSTTPKSRQADRDKPDRPKRHYRKTKDDNAVADRFAGEFSRHRNATKAAEAARPDLVEVGASKSYLRLVGHRMLTDENVSRAIEAHDKVRQENAALGMLHQRAVLSGEAIAPSEEVGRMARHAIEQEHGKATQKIESKHTLLKVRIDLTKQREPERSDVIDVPASKPKPKIKQR